MKNWKIELKWALFFIGLQIGWILLERVLGLHGEHIDKHVLFTNFFAFPAIAVYILAILDTRKNFYQGLMTYIQGFKSGLIITLFVTIASPLTQFIISEAVSPDYFSNAITYSVSEGKLSQEEAEDFFSLNNYILQSVIGTPIMGILTSAVVALFLRKSA